MYPIKPNPTDRAKKLFQQACTIENMSAKWGQSLSSEENAIRRFILSQAPFLGRLPYLTEVEEYFTQIPDDRIRTILLRLDQLDVIHLNNNQTAIAAAYPFSGSSTSHVVIFKKEAFKSLYAMCAIDALGVGFMFNCDVIIESNCFHCNEKVRIVIQNNEIVSLSPEELVVWGDMEYSNCESVSVCKNINFFFSENHFTQWQKKMPNRSGSLLQIQEALYLGKMFFEKRLKTWREEDQ